jgi:hypothetical protein
MPRPNWSRRLPRTLKIPGVMDLVTLADVRALIGHLPKETRAKSTWQVADATRAPKLHRDIARNTNRRVPGPLLNGAPIHDLDRVSSLGMLRVCRDCFHS